MAVLKSGAVLLEDETLALEIKAKLLVSSPWIILRIAGDIVRFFGQIAGFRKDGYLVVTNKRVIEIYRQRFLWFFHCRKTVKNFRLSSIKEVDSVKKGTWACFFRSYQLYYERPFRRIYVILKGLNDDETQKAVNTFFKAIL